MGDYLSESQHVDFYCKGQIEYRLPDRTRVDCLTDKYAIEYDWAHKWAECAGQALFYARETKKTPACVLIVKGDKDKRFIMRYLKAVSDTDAKLFTVEAIKK